MEDGLRTQGHYCPSSCVSTPAARTGMVQGGKRTPARPFNPRGGILQGKRAFMDASIVAELQQGCK